MLPFLDLNANDLIAFSQHKIQFCRTAALPIVKVIVLGSQLLGHIVFRDSTHESIPIAGEHRLLRETGFHSQQAHIVHVELERRQVSINRDWLKGLIDALAFQHNTGQVQPFNGGPKQCCAAAFLDDLILELLVILGQLRRNGVVAQVTAHINWVQCLFMFPFFVQKCSDAFKQRQCPVGRCLLQGVFLAHDPFSVINALHNTMAHRDRLLVKINILPLKTQDLATAQTIGQR